VIQDQGPTHVGRIEDNRCALVRNLSLRRPDVGMGKWQAKRRAVMMVVGRWAGGARCAGWGLLGESTGAAECEEQEHPGEEDWQSRDFA